MHSESGWLNNIRERAVDFGELNAAQKWGLLGGLSRQTASTGGASMPTMTGGDPYGIVGLLGVGVNLAQTILNYQQQNKAYNFNKKMQQLNWLYQADLQNRIFDREDSAVMRRVNDLRAAGLSPTLAAGSAAQSGSVVKTEAPETSPTMLNLGGLDPAKALIDSTASILALKQQEANIDRTYAENEYIQMQKRRAEADAKFIAMKTADTGWELNQKNISEVGNNSSQIGKTVKDLLNVSGLQGSVQSAKKKISGKLNDFQKAVDQFTLPNPFKK